MKFGVITDCQYADIDDWQPGEFDRRFRLSLAKLQEAINFFNTQELDFIVHLGDLIDQDINNLKPLKSILDSSKHQIKHVLGNHDFYVTFETDARRNDHQQLLDYLNMPSKHYSFISSGIKFIVLDTNEVGTIEWGSGSLEYKQGEELLKFEQAKGHIYAKPWNGAISEEQFEWLETEVRKSLDIGEKVVLFAHHQLFPVNRENMLKREMLLDLINNNENIIAFMNGHNHHGDFGVYEGVPCITFQGMVESDNNAYAIAEITKEELIVTGYDRQKSYKKKIKVVN